jgi:hypothetical protein
MSDFKKLGCGANCPTKTGFTDCEGEPILSNATLATCADLAGVSESIPDPTEVTVTPVVTDGNTTATIIVDGVPTDIEESITRVTDLDYSPGTSMLSLTFLNETGVPETSEVEIPIKVAVEHISPITIDPNGTYTQYADKIVVDAAGNFYGFNLAGQPTKLNITETVTRFKSLKTTGNPIGTYENEQIADFILRETITGPKSLSYNKATGVLTLVHTDETGTDITKTTTIKSQATAFINGTNPATATIFSLTTPPTVNDNSLKNNDDYVYVGTDGSYWFWNGTAYVTAPVPAATTEWLVAGTNVDAKGDKVGRIARTGFVTIGQNLVATTPLDLWRTTPDKYSVLCRMLNPSNKVATNNTMFLFGAAQETGNCGDMRFYYAGNNSANNRMDFGFSGYINPTLTFTVGGRVGIRTVTPNSTLQNNGSISLPIKQTPGTVVLTEFDYTLILTSPTSNQSLPSAAGIDGRIYNIRNNSGGNTFVTGLIGGPTSNTITLPSGAVRTFQALGGVWWIVSGFNP